MGEVLFCEQRLKPGHTMLDVGGNIGLYALLAGKLVGPTGRAHAFEPEELNAARPRAKAHEASTTSAFSRPPLFRNGHGEAQRVRLPVQRLAFAGSS